MQISKEIEIIPDRYYGYSVADWNKEAGCDGITIQTFNISKTGRENSHHITMNKEVAIAIANAIFELCNEK